MVDIRIASVSGKCESSPLNLLLFSVAGVEFGVDAEQVSGIEAYGGDQSDDLFWFHEELDFGGTAPKYYSPTVVTIRTGAGPSYRVIIDAMEDIAEFSQDDIRLFPALLEPFALKMGLWGILSRNGRMVLLLDFLQLLKSRKSDRTEIES